MNRLDQIELGGIVTIRDELLKQQAEGKTIYRLESGTPNFEVPLPAKNGIICALEENKTAYTAGAGITPLRQRILKKVRSKNKLPIISHEQIYITNGAMNGLYCVLGSILEDHRSVIVIADPTWTETADIITAHGGGILRIRTEDSNFKLNTNLLEMIERSDITNYNAIAGIVINSPHNPTGMVYTEKELQELTDFAEKHDLWLISDEAYEDIIFNKKHISLGSFGYNKTISIYSFSKSYAMSGLRLGYVVLNTPNKKIEERIQKLLRMTVNGVNSITQWGALEALFDISNNLVIEEMKKDYQIRRDIIFNKIRELKILNPTYPDGAFYLWCKVNECNDFTKSKYQNRGDWLSNILLNKGVGCIPGKVFGPASKDYVRFSFTCGINELHEAIKIIIETLKQYE